MAIISLALLGAPAAYACGHVGHAHGNCASIEVEIDYNDDDDDRYDDPPQASVETSDRGEDTLMFQYGMHFLPDAPAHHLSARTMGPKDAYIGGELRYLPAADVLWSGRVGAGVDVFGKSNWDLTLGLFLGTAGIWDREIDRAVLYATPIGGTEIGLGVEGDRLFGRYRWLMGWGAGEVSEVLTENELTVGYKVTNALHLYGQWLRLNPGESEKESGVGLGARLAF